MKILVVGQEGQVGWELARVLPPVGALTCLSRSELDLREPDRIRRALAEARPDGGQRAAGAQPLVPDRRDKTADDIEAHGFDLAGTLHAVEPASIACIPLYALCDKGDIGGLSYTLYPDFRHPAIFIYDGYEGGIGLTRRAFDVIEEWFRTTLLIIKECTCDEGCPSCVQDPQCGSANQPLDKEGALFLLKTFLPDETGSASL